MRIFKAAISFDSFEMIGKSRNCDVSSILESIYNRARDGYTIAHLES